MYTMNPYQKIAELEHKIRVLEAANAEMVKTLTSLAEIRICNRRLYKKHKK